MSPEETAADAASGDGEEAPGTAEAAGGRRRSPARRRSSSAGRSSGSTQREASAETTAGSQGSSVSKRKAPAGKSPSKSPSRSPRSRKAAASSAGSRSEQKERTRRSLLDAALARMAGDQAFTDISIREITGDAGVVPATFYRHFADMGEVGLVLVDESFTELRQVMRAIRAQPVSTAELVENSVVAFLGYAREHPRHFRFIGKERNGGSSALRMALGREMQLWVSELATDLARFHQARDLTTDELMAVASLVIAAVWSGTERVVDLLPGPSGDGQYEVIRSEVELQVNVILAGAIFYPAYRQGSFSMSAARMVANVRKELEKSKKKSK